MMSEPDVDNAGARGTDETRRALNIALPLAFGVLGFGFRLLAGGLANDHFMHMAWAQQLLLGELPGRDFIDPGMPLTFGLSAAAQALLPGPFAEVLLTSVMLGLAAALTYVVAAHLSASRMAGASAALLEIALLPRLYNYPKILLPPLALLALGLYALRPAKSRLAMLAAATVIAFLFRHDHGVYAALGITTGLLVIHLTDWRSLLSAVSSYAVLTIVFLLPYLGFVQWAGGVAEHFREGVEFSKSDEHQLMSQPPEFPYLEGGEHREWSRDDSAAVLFYAIYALAIVSISVVFARRRQLSRARLAVSAASVAMLLAYIAVILRHPITARVPDLAALFAITGTWTVSELVRVIRAELAFTGPLSGSRIQLGRSARWVRAAVIGTISAAAVTAVLFCVWRLGNVGEQIDKTDVLRGIRKTGENLADMARGGTQWPWEDFWPTSGSMPDAIRYLNACTAPSDEVLVTWNAPEYYFFARRKFGSGLALFLPPRAFTTARDQQRMLSRLRRQHVPVAMINETRREEFARAYPLVEAYLQSYYEPVGQFTIYDGSRISIALRQDERGARSWGSEGWPCGFDTRRAHS